MFYRFAAACAVGSVLIAIGTLGTLLLRLPPDGARILTAAWCFVPAAWGLWAILAPSRFVPDRLPAWGAILGLVAGIMAGPVLDFPLRIGGFRTGARWIPIIIGPIFYYLLWLLVRAAYRSLHATFQSAGAAGARSTGR